MLKPFTLRKKVVILLFLIVIAYTALHFAIHRALLAPAYSALEHTEAGEDLARCVAALQRDAKYLDVMVRDWSSWDDTYRFVQDRNRTYIESNLLDNVFKNAKLDLIGYADATGTVFWCKVLLPDRKEPVACRAEPTGWTPVTPPLLLPQALSEPLSGIAMTELGPMIVASRPVMDSLEKSPPRGVCLMGRFLTKSRIQDLVAQTRVNFSVWPLAGDAIPPEERVFLDRIDPKTKTLVREASARELYGYEYVEDITGKPALLVRATSPRAPMRFVVVSSRCAWILSAATALAVLLVMFALMERTVIRPLREITRLASEVGNNGNLAVRLPTGRRDEIGVLSEEFNRMIGRLQEDSLQRAETESALCLTRDRLEERVEERTAQLADTNESLKEEMRSREEAQQWSQLQATALDTAETGVVIADEAKCILWVNSAYCGLSGYAAEEVLGKAVYPLMLSEADYANMLAIVSLGEVWRKEVACHRRDGSQYTAVVTVTTRGENTGTPTHYMIIQQDVSEQRRLEEELRQAQKMEAVGRLAGGIAHDFNNLLATIAGYGQLILQNDGLDPDAREGLEEMIHAAGRATVLARQLLAFSRRQILMPRVVDLNRTVGDLERMLLRVLGEGIRLETRLKPDLERVKVDPGQIEHVLMNLVSNARDAMPDGGLLAIETDNVVVEAEPGRTADLYPGRYVMLAVHDTGAGMDPETQARIFEPFFTTKPAGKGTGLGLSMVYGIVKQSGGHVSVSSELGKGTSFRVFLPATGEAPAPAQGKVDTRLAGSGEVILVVEDEEDVRRLTRRMLEKWGYVVLEAPNGKRALEILAEPPVRVDLVLTDVVMPDVNGCELSDRIASLRPDVGLVFMSGYADEDVVLSGIQREGRGFVQKPFTPETLLSQLRKQLNRGV